MKDDVLTYSFSHEPALGRRFSFSSVLKCNAAAALSSVRVAIPVAAGLELMKPGAGLKLKPEMLDIRHWNDNFHRRERRCCVGLRHRPGREWIDVR